MTAFLAEYPRPAAPPADARANGHQPIIVLPDWTSRNAVDEPTDHRPTDRPTDNPADRPTDTTTDRPVAAATVKAVAPLVVVNGLAVYGQLAYALEHIAPTYWVIPARIALAVGFAAAVESVALYVGWHAHDALLLKSHATARNLRRWSFLIAAAVAAMNYAHFAAVGLRPTAAACAFGLLSLLSPWMWGLHTRRAARLQLLKERKVDEGGAEFSSERRRNFPIRTWQARRWSIDHGVTDPRAAWGGYNADRRARLAERQTGRLADRLSASSTAGERTDCRTDRLALPRPTGQPTDRPTALPDRLPTDRPTGQPTVEATAVPTGSATDRPTAEPTVDPTESATDRHPVPPTEEPTDRPTETTPADPTGQSATRPTDRPKSRQQPTGRGVGKHSAAAVANAALLRERYGDRLAESAYVMRRSMGGWSHERMVAAVAAHKAKADLSVGSPNGGGNRPLPIGAP